MWAICVQIFNVLLGLVSSGNGRAGNMLFSHKKANWQFWAPGNRTFQWTPNVKRLAKSYGGSETEQAYKASLCWPKPAECGSWLFAWEISHVQCSYIKILDHFALSLAKNSSWPCIAILVATLHLGSGCILVVNIRSVHGVWWLPLSWKESWIISP